MPSQEGLAPPLRLELLRSSFIPFILAFFISSSAFCLQSRHLSGRGETSCQSPRCKSRCTFERACSPHLIRLLVTCASVICLFCRRFLVYIVGVALPGIFHKLPLTFSLRPALLAVGGPRRSNGGPRRRVGGSRRRRNLSRRLLQFAIVRLIICCVQP